MADPVPEAVPDGLLSTLGIGVLRARRDEAGGFRVVSANRAYRGALPAGDHHGVVGSSPDASLPSGAGQVAIALLEQAYHVGRAHRDAVRTDWSDGRVCWYQLLGARDLADPTITTMLAIDITSTVATRDAADRVAAERASIVAALRDTVLVVDAGHRVRDANTAASTMLGDPLVGEDWDTIRSRIGLERLSEAGPRLLDLAFEGEEPAPIDVRLTRPDGETLLGRAAAQPVRSGGQVVGVAVIIADVTEERRLDDERKRLLERLLTQEEALTSQLAARLHDGPIQGLTELTMVAGMAMDAGEPLDPEPIVRLVDRTSRQTRAVLDDLRSEPVSDGVSAALERLVVDWMTDDPHARILIGGDALPRMPRGHEALTYQVATEVVRNARKHAPGSEVYVDQRVEDGHGVIEVTDQGPGCTAEQRQVAAERGHLGLILCRERIAAIGGSFGLWSQPGSGTQVTVRVPLRTTGAEPGTSNRAGGEGSDPPSGA